MHPLYFHRRPPIIVASKQESIKSRAFLIAGLDVVNLRPHITHTWLLYGWAALIVLLLIYAVIGERGAIQLWRLQGEKLKLDEQNYRLQKDNEALRERISRLRTDNFFLEKIAREELNLVRPGEVIYRFRARRQEDNNTRATGSSEPPRPGGQKPPR
jgi:cell division protein FtsB